MSTFKQAVKRTADGEVSREIKKQPLVAVDNKQVSYVTPTDEDYPQLVASKYANFAVKQNEAFPTYLQEKLAWAFNTLQAEGFFHRDWVRVKGRSFPTYVSRILIGDPGVTYKYLGLRLFALPWSFQERSPQTDVERACSILGELNTYFKEMSQKLITEKRTSDPSIASSSTNVCESSKETRTGDHKKGSGDLEGTGGTSSPMVGEDLTEQLQTRNKDNVTVKDSMCADSNHVQNDNKKDQVRNSDVPNGGLNSLIPNPRLVSDTSHLSTTQPLTLEEGTNFSVALLNYMDPNDPNLRLKEEPYYGMGDVAVSWHMDTGLIKGSTVAVYNHTETENCNRDDCNKWCVGLKVQWDVETPALAVPLDTGDSYYMLSDLNDTHQHCVIVGSHPRFSSTHRVAECSTGTLSYIQSRCQEALQNLDVGNTEGENGKPSLKSTSIDAISLTEEIHTEVEFDWLRQFWMQGTTRASERDYWKQPLEDLEEMWNQMELMTKLAIDAAMQGSNSENHSLCERLIDFLSRRNRLRQEYVNRFGGKSLVTMPSDEMPSYRPYWQDADPSYPLPFDLDDIIHKLECHLDVYKS